MSEDPFSGYIRVEVYPVMSKISITFALLAVVTMVALSIYDFKLVNRVTLGLQTAISSYDIWLHSVPFWARVHATPESTLCPFIGYQGVAFPLLYCFLNVAIGINLQLVFIHGIKTTKKIEAGYWIGSILLTLIITIPPLAMGMFGFSKLNGCYLITDDETFSRMFHFFTNSLVMIICMGYLLVVVILVLIKLYRGLNITEEQKLATDDDQLLKGIKNIKMLASRVLLYPMIMIFTHIGLVLNKGMYDLTGSDIVELDVFSYLSGGTLGTLNFIAFCCDPTVHSAVKEIYLRFATKKRSCNSTDIASSFI